MISDRFAVIGDPIDHSLSPAMHTAAFRAADLDAVYEPHRVADSALAAHVAHLRTEYKGFNVTIPHKEAIYRLLDALDPGAEALGAVNTVAVKGGKLIGYNTDPVGFLRSLRHAGVDPTGADVLVFGAGGAARAVVRGLLNAGARVAVANRTAGRARALADSMSPRVYPVSADELAVAVARANIVVNATPLGMSHLPGDSPLPAGTELRPNTIAVDLIYGRETPFLRAAVQQRCRTLDGLEMLVQQGAESFRLWTGVEPDLDVMREACLREMEARECSVS